MHQLNKRDSLSLVFKQILISENIAHHQYFLPLSLANVAMTKNTVTSN